VATEPGSLRSGFGTLGRLEVSEVLKIDFCLLPTAEAARPLWGPFSLGAVGALVMEDSELAVKQARYFGTALRLPVVIATGAASHGLITATTMPSLLRGVPGGSSMVNTDLTAAVRTLLLATLHPAVDQSIPETVVTLPPPPSVSKKKKTSG
jgi:hypothetical protein